MRYTEQHFDKQILNLHHIFNFLFKLRKCDGVGFSVFRILISQLSTCRRLLHPPEFTKAIENFETFFNYRWHRSMNNTMQDMRPNGCVTLCAQQSSAEPFEGGGTAIAYINPAILLATIFANNVTAKDGAIAKRDFGELVFHPPIETMITLLELSLVVQKATTLSIKIKPDVYTNGFRPSKTIYVRNARTIGELIDMFAKASGLHWHVSDEGTVEIFREPVTASHSLARIDVTADASEIPARYLTTSNFEFDRVESAWSPRGRPRYV